MKKKSSASQRRSAKSSGSDFWRLRLYIAGQTPNSIAAITNLKKICEDQLRGRYRIEVIDLLEKPQLAKGDQIIAIPTLVRRLPPPVKKIAKRIFVSVKTVETYRARIADKLELRTRSEVVRYAIRMGLLAAESLES